MSQYLCGADVIATVDNKGGATIENLNNRARGPPGPVAARVAIYQQITHLNPGVATNFALTLGSHLSALLQRALVVGAQIRVLCEQAICDLAKSFHLICTCTRSSPSRASRPQCRAPDVVAARPFRVSSSWFRPDPFHRPRRRCRSRR